MKTKMSQRARNRARAIFKRAKQYGPISKVWIDRYAKGRDISLAFDGCGFTQILRIRCDGSIRYGETIT